LLPVGLTFAKSLPILPTLTPSQRHFHYTRQTCRSQAVPLFEPTLFPWSEGTFLADLTRQLEESFPYERDQASQTWQPEGLDCSPAVSP